MREEYRTTLRASRTSLNSSGVSRVSINRCTARVPCMFLEMDTSSIEQPRTTSNLHKARLASEDDRSIRCQIPLSSSALLNELLAEVVAEGIAHEVGNVRDHLVEDDIALREIIILQLFLQEAAAVLVEAHHRNLSDAKAMNEDGMIEKASSESYHSSNFRFW